MNDPETTNGELNLSSEPQTAPIAESAATAALARALEDPDAERHARKVPILINVRYSERSYPMDVLVKLHTLRMEVTALNRSLRQRNETIRSLRSDKRLHARVMRLRAESATRAVELDRAVSSLKRGEHSPSPVPASSVQPETAEPEAAKAAQ